MRTNHLENPLGFAIDEPTFSWVACNTAGKRQTASRLRVSSDPEMSSCIYDSGYRGDLSSLGVTCKLALEPRTRYYWQVEVIADNGDHATSDIAWFETAKQTEPWSGEWIQAPFDKDTHPIFTRTLTLPDKPVRARAYMTALGLYEFRVNGIKAGDEVLAPFYHDYNLWLQYQTLDLTGLFDKGENRLECWLGNGWYKGRFGFLEHLDKLYGDQLQWLGEIRLEFPDGSNMVIGSDREWQCRLSPVLESSIYDGEVYDARKVTEPSADDPHAVPAEGASAPLSARLSPPLRVVDQVHPVKILHTPKNETVIDFGQLMTGWVEFNVDISKDQKVFLQFGELLQNDCFYNENLRSAKEEFTWISDGRPAHVRPHFTFYGFRFMKVEGIPEVRLEDFVGCVIHTDIPVTGKIETGLPKINQLIHNTFWGQIGNFVDTPTDCPQRDERMGWTGDAHVFAPTASFHMYTPAFYTKYLHDMLLEQEQLDGSVPHVVPDVLDQIKTKFMNQKEPTDFGSCAWGDAAIGIPWTLYTFFGDKTLLQRQYPNMKMWTDWIQKQDETRCGGRRLWMCGFHFADWLALDNPVQGSSFGGTDPYFIASCFYYNAARTTARAAKVLGLEDDKKKYAALAKEIKNAFREEFFSPAGRLAERTQTAMVMALNLGLAPKKDRQRLRDELREKIKARGDHLDTGFVGTYYLCPTLTVNGMADVAYTLLLNEDFPSWLYEVNMGATTVWERWNSVLPNGLVSDTGMNSMNHYAYGAIAEWMYRYMGGINPDPKEPGFRHAFITPYTDERMDHISVEYDSASGLYKSAWKHTNGGIEYTVTVPFDCTAEFVPETNRGDWSCNGLPFTGSIHLPAGTYTILCK